MDFVRILIRSIHQKRISELMRALNWEPVGSITLAVSTLVHWCHWIEKWMKTLADVLRMTISFKTNWSFHRAVFGRKQFSVFDLVKAKSVRRDRSDHFRPWIRFSPIINRHMMCQLAYLKLSAKSMLFRSVQFSLLIWGWAVCYAPPLTSCVDRCNQYRLYGMLVSSPFKLIQKKKQKKTTDLYNRYLWMKWHKGLLLLLPWIYLEIWNWKKFKIESETRHWQVGMNKNQTEKTVCRTSRYS